MRGIHIFKAGKTSLARALLSFAIMLAGCTGVKAGVVVAPSEAMIAAAQVHIAVHANAAASPAIQPEASPSRDPAGVQPDPAGPAQAEPPDSRGNVAVAPGGAPKKAKLVALTFDDGPDGVYTPEILDILKRYEVKATFFLVGTQVAKYPDTVRRIVGEGHEIGNHTWSHKDLTKLSGKALDDQIRKAQEAIEAAAGVTPDLFRAPYGALSATLIGDLHKRNLKHVYWTVDTRDWAGTPVEEMRANVRKHARPGGIILMHSFGGRKNALAHTVEMLPLIIEDLRREGFAFATVDELIKEGQAAASVVK